MNIEKEYDYWWENTNLQRLTGRLKLHLLVGISGDFNEIRAKKSSTSPGLVSPESYYF
jgi:hypothetical protein